MRILGLDYGDKTIGLALSDEAGLIAQPLFTIERSNSIDVSVSITKICELLLDKDIDKIVLGMPVNMDGSEGERVKKTKWFAKKLAKKTEVEIVFWDERLSTMSASRVLDEGRVKRSEQKQYLDKLAAAIILQNYLDFEANKTNM